MQPVIMNAEGMARTLRRLSHEIEERNEGFSGVVLVGVKRGGEVVARRLSAIISETGRGDVPCAGLDITMSRDDLVSAFILPEAEKNDLGFPLEGKTVVLCDDVLHTGRSAVAGIEALFRLGASAKTAAAEPGGRGFGLVLVRQAVRRLGGDVEVESDGGAIVTVTLPLGDTEAAEGYASAGEEVHDRAEGDPGER